MQGAIYTLPQQLVQNGFAHVFKKWEERANKCIVFKGNYMQHLREIGL